MRSLLRRQFVEFAKAKGPFTLNAVRGHARGYATLRNSPQQHQDSAGVLPAIVGVVESYDHHQSCGELRSVV